MPRSLKIDIFIEELNKLKEKYKVKIKTDDPFSDVVIEDERTGEKYSVDGVPYE